MLSSRVEPFVESVIRDMTRLSLKHGAINLAQGFPDFPAPGAKARSTVYEKIAVTSAIGVRNYYRKFGTGARNRT